MLEVGKDKAVYQQGKFGDTFHMILAGSVSVYLDRMPSLEKTVMKTTASFKYKGRCAGGGWWAYDLWWCCCGRVRVARDNHAHRDVACSNAHTDFSNCTSDAPRPR